jgi:signal transduction histidine kinase
MTHLLQDTELDTQQLDYTETIRNSSEELLNIINDILGTQFVSNFHYAVTFAFLFV